MVSVEQFDVSGDGKVCEAEAFVGGTSRRVTGITASADSGDIHPAPPPKGQR
jgi:hypothetical protein